MVVRQGEECKRQLAILFSFIDENQPSELIEGLLGDVDNGQVSSLVIADPGGGYSGNIPRVSSALVLWLIGEIMHCVAFNCPNTYTVLVERYTGTSGE